MPASIDSESFQQTPERRNQIIVRRQSQRSPAIAQRFSCASVAACKSLLLWTHKISATLMEPTIADITQPTAYRNAQIVNSNPTGQRLHRHRHRPTLFGCKGHLEQTNNFTCVRKGTNTRRFTPSHRERTESKHQRRPRGEIQGLGTSAAPAVSGSCKPSEVHESWQM